MRWTYGKHPTADCWFVRLDGGLEVYIDTEEQARLIAAAPDLLVALQRIAAGTVAEFDWETQGDVLVCMDFEEAAEIARAAIARATQP